MRQKRRPRAEDAMDKFKVFGDFATKKTHSMVIFYTWEEFYDDYYEFSQEAFEEGYKLGKLDCCSQIMTWHPGLDFYFLDKQEEF